MIDHIFYSSEKPPDLQNITPHVQPMQSFATTDVLALRESIELPRLGPLRDHRIDPTTNITDVTFWNFLNHQGEWDIAKLGETFTPEAIQHILSIKPPSFTDMPDSCFWRWTSDHNFHLQSAYSNQVSETWNCLDPFWPQIWKLKVPQRLCLFLWLVHHQKLMTNVERCKRCLTLDPSCPICHTFDESTLHLLRDCPATKQIWEKLPPSCLPINFFSLCMDDWLRLNLGSNALIQDWNIPWNLVFTSLLWHIWKNRNEAVFAESSNTLDVVLSRSITLAKYYNEEWLSSCVVPSSPPCHNQWRCPESADKLAKLADPACFDTVIFENPPAVIEPSLLWIL
ncbi:hypothetical protein V6N11_019422 [Hibiscus sabdariffa]|uniref:Reverse transcriptase zinc-binding domain-containing protein n=1 Tax=Hibiscus sabdariffa TaxID=183260 RepID=A0ABR1ZRH6_9ROSI